MLRLALTFILGVVGTAVPQRDDARTSDGTPRDSFIVRCASLFDGERRIEDAWMVVRDGRIAQVGTGADVPTDLPVLDVRDRVVMPGIVVAASDLAGVRDSNYNVTPDFVALDNFDFDRSRTLALSGGVTTAYLGVGKNRLLPGQGSVVKLAGDDIVARALVDRAALHITLGKESTNAPPLFEPTISPTDDDPLTPARRQYPSARISQLATLRQLFDDAQRDVDAGPRGSNMVENRYDPTSLRDAASGKLPLRIAAREAADVLRALRFAKRLGARVVLDDPFEVAVIAKRVAAADALAVLRMPIAISATNPGGENRRVETVERSAHSPAAAAAAGVTFALAPQRDSDLADMLFIAAVAIRHGLDPAAAMRAITLDAARALGVESRVGALRAGMDADFVVLSGDPFAVGTMVEKTFIDGQPVFEREREEGLLAIRAGRVITADGPVLRDATVLVANGKIKAVGEELAVPYGATLIDMPDAVITPGFIDTFTSAGLAGDGTGIPTGTAGQRIGAVIRHDDDAFIAARSAGLTTLLVAGEDGRSMSGRVAAIKTGAADDASAVLKDIAALRMVHDAIGPDALKPIQDAIGRGKKYIDSWENYDKKRAEWEAKKAKEAEEGKAAAADEVKEAAPSDPISGRWEVRVVGLPLPVEILIVADVQLSGKKVTGSMRVTIDGNEGPPPIEIEKGRFDDGELTIEFDAQGQSGKIVAKVEDDTLTGGVEGIELPGGLAIRLEGKRVSKTAKKPDEDKGPQKPKIDENLEPLRALIEQKIPAVIRTDRAPAVRDVIEYFRSEKLPFVLQSVADAIETPDILGEDPPPVVLGPTLVRRDKGEVINHAAVLADRGVKLAFATGDTDGTRFLPLHTAHAIRWGLDPQAALRGLTIEAARMFMIDDRVGSLTRGKDADLVAFSGNPFELTSRVLLVVCNGRVVVDERKKQ